MNIGGQYRATQNPDGTWNLHDIPVLCTFGEDAGRSFAATEKWLGECFSNMKAHLVRGYLPPAHIEHHWSPDKSRNATSKAGFLRVGRLGAWQGQPTIFADVISIPPAVFEKIRDKTLSYTSVEVLSPEKKEITSIAFLSDHAPFFKFPLVTVGKTGPAGGFAFRETGGKVVELFSIHGGFRMPPDEAAGNPPATTVPAAAPVFPIAEFREMFAEMGRQIAAEVKAALPKAVEARDPAEGAKPAEPPARSPQAPVSPRSEMFAEAIGAAVAPLTTQIAALTGKIAGMEAAAASAAKEREGRDIAAAAVAGLRNEGWTVAETLEPALFQQFGLGGKPAVEAFVEGFKKHVPKALPTNFEQFAAGLSGREAARKPALLAGLGSEILEKFPEGEPRKALIKAAEMFEEIGGRGSFDKETFIENEAMNIMESKRKVEESAE